MADANPQPRGTLIRTWVGACIATAWLAGVLACTTQTLVIGAEHPTFNLLILYLALFWSTLFHEAGHVLAGLALGLRFASICVLPIRLSRFRGRLRLRPDPNFPLMIGQGVCIADDSNGLTRKMAILVAAGPLVGLTMSMACWMPFLLGLLPSGTDRSMLMSSIGITGLIVNLLSLIPDGQGSDGYCLWVLHRGGESARQFVATAMLGWRMLAGDRFEELPEALVVDSVGPTDRVNYAIVGANTAYFRALRLGRIDEAERHLATMDVLTRKGQKFSTMRRPIAMELAFFSAWFRADAPAARMFLDEAPRGRTMPAALARTVGAVLMAEGRMDEAREAIVPAIAGLARLDRLGDAIPTASIVASDLRAIAARLGVDVA